jgi:hypothetical protein
MLFALLLAAGIQDSTSYQEAVALYRRVELEKALVQLESSLPEAANDVERSKVHAWIGLVEWQLGHFERARAALTEAVRLDSTVALPAEPPPELVAVLEELREEAKGAQPAEQQPPPPPPEPEPAFAVSPGLIVAVAGCALILAGGVVFIVGTDTVYRQAQETRFQRDAIALRDRGYVEYGVGAAIASVGAVALATGITLLALE